MSRSGLQRVKSSHQLEDRNDSSYAMTSAMTVVELEKASGVPSHVIRYYTRVGLLKPDRNPVNGYKLFSARHLSRLAFIRQAKSLGYSLKEIMEINQHAKKGKSPCPRVREIIENRISENRKKLDSLMELQARMEKAVRGWKRLPDGVPTGDTVCYLIESFYD